MTTKNRPQSEPISTLARAAAGGPLVLALLMLVTMPALGGAMMPAAAVVLEASLRESVRRDVARDVVCETIERWQHACLADASDDDDARRTTVPAIVHHDETDHTWTPRLTRSGRLNLPPPAQA